MASIPPTTRENMGKKSGSVVLDMSGNNISDMNVMRKRRGKSKMIEDDVNSPKSIIQSIRNMTVDSTEITETIKEIIPEKTPVKKTEFETPQSGRKLRKMSSSTTSSSQPPINNNGNKHNNDDKFTLPPPAETVPKKGRRRRGAQNLNSETPVTTEVVKKTRAVAKKPRYMKTPPPDDDISSSSSEESLTPVDRKDNTRYELESEIIEQSPVIRGISADKLRNISLSDDDNDSNRKPKYQWIAQNAPKILQSMAKQQRKQIAHSGAGASDTSDEEFVLNSDNDNDEDDEEEDNDDTNTSDDNEIIKSSFGINATNRGEDINKISKDELKSLLTDAKKIVNKIAATKRTRRGSPTTPPTPPIHNTRNQNKNKTTTTTAATATSSESTKTRSAKLIESIAKNKKNAGKKSIMTAEEMKAKEELTEKLKRVKRLGKFLNMIDENRSDIEVHIDHLSEEVYRYILTQIEEQRPPTSRNNELQYFISLKDDEKRNILDEIDYISRLSKKEIPIKFQILSKDITKETKATALQKYAMMCTMSNENSEYHKIQEWLHGFLRIPFGIYRNLPVAKTDGRTACSRFMHESARILDESIYGHTVAKMQLIQYIGQLIANPDTAGNAIAIYGPPGTGKTSLIQNGVSKILHRPFHFISLGGSTDSSLLIGHGYTYEGSVWGRIVDILMQSQCMNPIIYFDELDKVSETEKGEEIIGILTHLTDITQNHHFHDRYFSGIDFDLSRVLFIFSYNDQTKINRILRDRMHNIEVKGFTVKDKIQIARKFLIPKIEEQLLLAAADFNIEIDNLVLTHIIEKYTENEKGVRNLKRAIETIWTKINLIQFIDQDDENIKNNREYFGFISKLRFNSGEKNSVSITTDVADLLMADRSTLNDNVSHSHMYA